MMKIVGFAQAAMSAVFFAALLWQLFVRFQLDLEKWHRATWIGIGFQVIATCFAALAVVVFGEQVDLATVLLIISNTAWLCCLNLILTIAIPIRHAKK